MSQTGERNGLEVTLNRERLNQVTAPESHSVAGGFDVVLRNEGEPAHVHLRFGGPLARATAVGTSNHYVDAGATRRVEVRVATVDAPVEGTLEIVTGHGAEGTEVAMTVEPPDTGVQVDESLGVPKGARSTGGGSAAASGSTASTVGQSSTSRQSAEPTDSVEPTDPAAQAASTADATDTKGVSRRVADLVGTALARHRHDTATLAVGGFALAALVGAVGLGAALESAAVTVGVVAVLISVAAALYLLFVP